MIVHVVRADRLLEGVLQPLHFGSVSFNEHFDLHELLLHTLGLPGASMAKRHDRRFERNHSKTLIPGVSSRP